MMEPTALNRLHLEDALIYGLEVTPSTQTVSLRIEVDARFHRGLAELGVEGAEEMLLDFLFCGVRSVTFDGLRNRPREWAADERPHDCEIAGFEVKKRMFRRNRYLLLIRCQLGQTCAIDFESVVVKPAGEAPASTHEYAG